MLSGSSRKPWVVPILTVIFILFAGKTASGITTSPTQPPAPPDTAPPTLPEARARLTEGFNQILEFFARRDFCRATAFSFMIPRL